MKQLKGLKNDENTNSSNLCSVSEAVFQSCFLKEEIMHNFKNLKIWQKSMDLVTDIYMLTSQFPRDEIFGLTSQTRRASVSIPLNISEGSAKSSNKDFSRFLEISIGSTNELETTLIIARNLQYIEDDLLIKFQVKITELRKMIFKFKESLGN